MLCADLMIGTNNRALKKGPCILYSVCMDVSAHPFFCAMAYRSMFIAFLVEILVCLEFISHDLGTLSDSLIDNTAENLFARCLDSSCLKRAFSLEQTHNRLFLPGTALSALVVLPAHVGFVHFHNAGKLWTGNGFGHSFSDTMAEVPCRFVADVQTPFQLIGRNALLGFCHEIDGKKPLPEGQMGVMEDRPCRDGELVAANVAIKLATLLYAAYLLRSAPRALYSSHPLKGFKVLAAFVVIAAVFFDEVYQINVHRNLP